MASMHRINPSLFPAKRTGVAPPPDWPGCKCNTSECSTKNCRCHKHMYGCTSKCTCERCDNIFGVRGSNPDTGFDLNKLPSSNIKEEQASDTKGSIEPQKADTSSMTGAQVTRQLQAPGAAASSSLKRKIVNGCSCQLSRCLDLQCSCYANDVKCSSKCTCQDCSNRGEPGGSNKNSEPGQGSADGISNVPDSNKRARTSCH